MLTKWEIYLSQIYLLITLCVSSAGTVEVRLNLGQSENQGQIEVRKNGSQSWGRVCDLHFGDLEAAVVCRQLNYRYGRNEKDVYIADLSDFVLENVRCKGNETNLSECIEGEWRVGTGECSARDHNYASVCCSNSPHFGETVDDMFVSDCVDFWLDAEENCESKGAILANVDQYNTFVGARDIGHRQKGFWTRQYFSPWLWDNGCYKISDPGVEVTEFTVRNNSAQLCFQLCSISSPTLFLLSGDKCRCLTTASDSMLTPVLPGWCNKQCEGNTRSRCGDDSLQYWSYYSIAPDDSFFRITDPLSTQDKQCAIVTTARKLVTADCDAKYGYICGQVEVDGSLRLLFFKKSLSYEKTKIEAQKTCYVSDVSMYLIGQDVMTYKSVINSFEDMWVNVMRTLAVVHQVDTDVDVKGGAGRLRSFNPKWCLARKLRNQYYVEELSLCQRERHSYICTKDRNKDGTTTNNGSADESTTGSTIFNITVTTVSDHSSNMNTSVPDIHSLITIIVSVLSVVTCLCIAVAVVFCWCKRSKKKGNDDTVNFNKKSGRLRSALCGRRQNQYQASIHISNSPEHIYNEILDPSSNVYNEIDNLIPEPNEDVTDEDVVNKPLPPEPVDTGDVVDDDDDGDDDDINGDLTDAGNKDQVIDIYSTTTDPNNDSNKDSAGVNTERSDTDKEPVTFKRSYSTPHDLVQAGETDPSSSFVDPSYIYPYDHLHIKRSDTQTDDIKDDSDKPVLEMSFENVTVDTKQDTDNTNESRQTVV